LRQNFNYEGDRKMTDSIGKIFYEGKIYDKNSIEDAVRLLDVFLENHGSLEEFHRVFEEMTGETVEESLRRNFYLSNIINSITWSEAEASYGYDGNESLNNLNSEWIEICESIYSGPIMTPAKGYDGNRMSNFVPMKIGEM